MFLRVQLIWHRDQVQRGDNQSLAQEQPSVGQENHQALQPATLDQNLPGRQLFLFQDQ